MKWLVVWFWLNTFVVPCPQPNIFPDKFGRIPEINSYTLQACYKTERIRKERVFNTKKEAEDFVKEGQKENDLTDFEIKETYTNKEVQ